MFTIPFVVHVKTMLNFNLITQIIFLVKLITLRTKYALARALRTKLAIFRTRNAFVFTV
jgi:hypothetical protein